MSGLWRSLSREYQDLLGDSGMDFDQLSSKEKTLYVLEVGDAICCFAPVKEFIVDGWEFRNTNCTVAMCALIILSPSLWPGIYCLLLGLGG